MKHFPPIATSLIFVAVLIVFARYDKQALPVQEESVNEGATFQGSSIIEVNGLLGDANEPTGAVTSVVPDVVSNLLAEAGTESVGGTLRLPNPLGPPLAGIIAKIKQENRDVYEVSGRLEAPQAGWFFLRRQLQPGKAGSFVGLIDIVSENRVLQLTASEVRSLPRPEVVCMGYPAREADHEADVDFVSRAFLASVMPGVDVNAIPIPAYQNGVVPLQSLRGAKAVIYLDYDGESVSSWGGVDAAGYAICAEELLEVWERVAEDYLPFNINVTTDEAVYLAAAESSRVRCIVTPTTDAAPGAGGVAYLNSFNWEGDVPCWAFYRKGKNAAEVISHEVGHTLGLSHDGIASPTQTTSYYSGHGSGNTGWAPIMGVGYYGNLSQWSKGEYAYANNTQDDLQIITSANNDVAYRADDHGNTRVAGTSLEIYPDDSVANRLTHVVDRRLNHVDVVSRRCTCQVGGGQLRSDFGTGSC